VLTHDRRLLRFDEPNKGGLHLAEGLMRGRVCWASPALHGDVSYAVIGRQEAPHLALLAVDVKTGQCSSVQLDTKSPNVLAVDGHGRVIFLVSGAFVEAYNMASGQHIHTLELPPSLATRMRPPINRFLGIYDTSEWFALSFDGVKVRLDQVRCATGQELPPLIGVFDRLAGEDPMAIANNGDLCCTVTGKRTPLRQGADCDTLGGPPFLFHAVSRDGSRIVSMANVELFAAELWCIATKSGEITGTRWSETRGFEDIYSRYCIWGDVTIRRRFRAILMDNKSRLTLVSRSGQTL
jgi:hypothetical protein